MGVSFFNPHNSSILLFADTIAIVLKSCSVGKNAKISLISLPGYIAENKDFLRIRKSSGFWELEEDDNKNVKVIYQFQGEPGGEIPAWPANSFIVRQTFETHKKLKNKLRTK